VKLIRSREIQFEEFVPFFLQPPKSARRRALIVPLTLLISFVWGCAGRGAPNSNSNAVSNTKPSTDGNANAETRPSSSQPAAIDIKEPERYGAAMTISIQGASGAPASMATQQFGYAKLGADRRWAFTLPAPLGRTVYLEKSGLKYLILLDRKQYVELAPDPLGFQMSKELTLGAIAERLKPRVQFEQLGLEPINARTAMKYRLTSATDASTRIDGVIFVDQETGLLLRSELNTASPSGEKSRVIVEARDLQLNPDRSEFDVPAGMKKVSPQEAKQQIEGFVSAIGSVVSGRWSVAGGR
jgi:hypothetical protein